MMDDEEFIKLDCWMSQVLVVSAHTFYEPSAFALSGEGNGFFASTALVDIEKWLKAHTNLSNNTLMHDIDLTAMDGTKRCGKPVVTSRLLTLEEYRKYRDVLPRMDVPYWLATPSRSTEGENYMVCVVMPDGSVEERPIDAEGIYILPAMYLHLESTVYTDDSQCEGWIAAIAEMSGDTATLRSLPVGAKFKMDDDMCYIKMDGVDTILAVSEDRVDGLYPFDNNKTHSNTCNFAASTLLSSCNGWLDTQIRHHKQVGKSCLELMTDLRTLDGRMDFGTHITRVRPMTYDEYTKYRGVFPNIRAAYWLATGWTPVPAEDEVPRACMVLPDGHVEAVPVVSMGALRLILHLDGNAVVRRVN